MSNGTISPYQVSDYGQFALITWCSTAGVAALIGNAILFVSLVYRSLKIDKISAVLLQSLAFRDVLFAALVILPTVSGVTDQQWMYGSLLCTFNAYVTIILQHVGTYHISALNISKLTCLLFPLRSITRTRRAGYYLTGAVWGVVLTILLVLRVVVYRSVVYNPLVYSCNFDYSSGPTMFERVVVFNSIFVPLGVVLITGGWLMLYIQRVRGLSRQGAVSLSAVSAVFLVSYMPFLVFVFTSRSIIGMSLFNMRLYLIATKATFLSPASNPILIYKTVSSFQSFVQRGAVWLVGKKIMAFVTTTTTTTNSSSGELPRMPVMRIAWGKTLA